MDRKSLIFVFFTATLLLFVNQWLSNRNVRHKQNEQRHASTLSNTKKESTQSQAPLVLKPVNASQFQTVTLFNSDQELLSTAIVYGSHYIVGHAHLERLPQSAYLSQKNGQTETLSLNYQSDTGLAIYSSRLEDELTTVFIPQVGSQALQLVDTSSSQPVVHAVEYRNGELKFPGEKLKNDAIAFFQANNKLYPVAFYDGKSQNISFFTEYKDLRPVLSFATLQRFDSKGQNESFYVLENHEMQVVFSSLGGSIAEINLKQKTKANPNSIVLKTAIDTKISETSPQNAQFPLREAMTVKNGKSFTVKPTIGGYYPLLRRDFFAKDPKPEIDARSRFYACMLLSDDPKFVDADYTLKKQTDSLIEFTASKEGRKITKTYRLAKGHLPYCLHVDIQVQGRGENLYIRSGVPETELMSGSPAPALLYLTGKKGKVVSKQMSLPKYSNTVETSASWVANTNTYYGVIMQPLSLKRVDAVKVNRIPGQLMPSRIHAVGEKYDQYPVDKYPGYEILVPMNNESSYSLRLYTGPFSRTVLNNVDAQITKTTGNDPMFVKAKSFQSIFSFISEPFAMFLMVILNFFHRITHSWGWSIILLTVVLRVLLYPFNAWAFSSTAKVKKLNPKIAALEKRYKNDPQKREQEKMKLYNQEGANPLAGCLPILIQIPLIAGILDLLRNSFAFKGAVFIPGWINDLSAPDVIFSWGYPLPFFGTSFHLLPLILAGLMYWQQKIMSGSKDVNNMSETERQQQLSGNIMAVVFFVLFYYAPSGLNLYWLFSTLLGIGQQWYTNKKLGVA